ncbi:expressed unknown protein [Seminavis robusta]|uniref:Uncharacterized protein n=1 Tax=Seminavis robusta TaxID=568900 RepID=A0A9N8HZ82_9STRA|nr:expressed unknown protein [Seminavis robusta]|eukprot:Sro3349_g347060.1 n/a (408) ;mRNA; r:3508-4731
MDANDSVILKAPLVEVGARREATLERLLLKVDACEDLAIHGSFVKSLDNATCLWDRCSCSSATLKHLMLTRFLTGSFPLQASTLTSLLQSSLGRQLESLDLTAVDVHDDEAGESSSDQGGFAKVLQAVRSLGQLKKLCLDDIFFEERAQQHRYGIDSILQALTAPGSTTATHLEALQVVQVFHRGGNISTATMEAVCRLQCLKTLKLTGVRLPHDLVTAMTETLSSRQEHAQTLEHLHLDAAVISRDSFVCIARMLQHNRSIQKLELLRLRRDEFLGKPVQSDQGLDDAIVREFAIALRRNNTLLELHASPVGAVTEVGYSEMEMLLQHHNHTLDQLVATVGLSAEHDEIMFRVQRLLQLHNFGLRQAESMSKAIFLDALISCCSEISLDCLFYLFFANPSLARFLQ